MQRKRIFWSTIISIALFIFLAGACSNNDDSTTVQEPVKIRVAVLPILDTLPMYVAEVEGLYSEYNIQVEFIPVGSAPERDQLIVAGQADGMVNEIVSTLFYNKDQIQVQTVRYARSATKDAPLFHILAASNSEVGAIEDLRNVEIGISEGTVIEYLTDRMLESQGFSQDEIKTVAVPKISDRMSLLGTGELKAAVLPDPLTFLAVQQGASIVLDDTIIPEYSFSTITFRKDFIDQNPEAVRGFLAAIEEATLKINADPKNYASVLTDQKLVPAPILEAYKINPYPTAGIPTEAQWNDVVQWAKVKGLLDNDVSYKDSVTEKYLP